MSARPSPGRIRPSRWWALASLALLLVGIGGCSTLSIASAWDVFDPEVLEGDRVGLDAGTYTIFTAFVGSRVSVEGPTGEAIELDDYDGEITVTRGTLDYEATSTFTAPVDGVYTVAVDGPGRVAIGSGLRAGLLALGLVVGSIAALVGFVVLIVVLTKRSSSRNRVRAAEFAAARGGPGAPPPPPPPWPR